MATRADELLADLMESGSEGEDDHQPDTFLGDDEPNGRYGANGDMDLMDEESDEGEDEEESRVTKLKAANSVSVEDEDEEEAKARIEKMDLGDVSDVGSIARLMGSLKPVLQKIEYYQNLPPEKQTKNTGSIEDNPEYRLLTQANATSSAIDNEIMLVHKFIRDHYHARFPELEMLTIGPLMYAKAVAIIGNGPLDNMEKLSTSTENIVGQSLKQILDGATLMVVRLEATKTSGRPLADEELRAVMRACDMTFNLDRAKKTLAEYVQSRMNLFAPNLTILVGSETAAALVNAAGGLTGLAKMPACNIAAMGQRHKAFGLATNTRVRRQGHLYHSPIIQTIPSDLKNQAMRIVSAKLVLAARMDKVHASPNGSDGEKLRQQCQERLDKLTEPAPNTGVKALPAPDRKPSRKRGGRRARQAKEATVMTDLRRAQNRMAFGKEEQEVGYGTGDSTQGLGMVGQSSDGRVRATKIDQRTRAKLSKKNPGWGGTTTVGGMANSLKGFNQGGSTVLPGHGLRSSGGGAGAGQGTSSVIAFTPFQGLELVNPKAKEEMERKRKAEEDKWFKSGVFTQVGGGTAAAKSGGVGGEGKVDDAGFKIPALPAIKRLKGGQ